MKLKHLIAASLLTLCVSSPLTAYARNLENNGSGSGEIGSTYSDGMFTFKYVEGGVELCGVDTSALAVLLPDETDGRMIVGISDGAFYGCTSLQTVEFGKYVRSIGSSAFTGCESLTAITIPESVVSMGRDVFNGCTALTSVELSPNVREIPEGTFYACVQLEDLTIPEGVTAIGPEAFYNCYMLKSITIPEGVETLGDYAFAFCGNLTDAALPSTITTLGSGVYCGCEGLTGFTVPESTTDLGTLSFIGCKGLAAYDVAEGNETYTVQDGVLYQAEGSILYAYPAGAPAERFTIPEGVVRVGDAAFFTAEHLKEVDFPSTLHYIGAGAFEYCASLQKVELPDTVEIIFDNAFSDCDSLSSVRLPDTMQEIGSYAFFECPKLKEVTVPKAKIGDYAFGYIDSGEKDDAGKPVPVKLSGFKQHGSGTLSTVLLILGGCCFLVAIISVLVKVIRKTQLTMEEQEQIADANEENYVSLAKEE